MTGRVLETADLIWRDDQTPVSSRFDDIYFSTDNGCQESRYVFIDQNRLPERFKNLKKNHFTIAETGFGTGLNFLNTLALWRQNRRPGQKLYFISTELYPLDDEAMARSHGQWPEFADLSQQLLEAWPPPIEGQHTLELSDGVTLILLQGDAEEGFRQLLENGCPALCCDRLRAVDAWFLDGFAPGKNESLWQPALFRLMARLSRPGTTAATFSAAGVVKRGLRSNGFAVTKAPGFGKKRDMLTAVYQGLPDSTVIESNTRSRDSLPFWPVYRKQRHYRSVIVIGAGIAGCTTARALAEAGMDVVLMDQHEKPMQEGSGNPQAVLFPKLSLGHDAFSDFNLLSILYAWRYYRQPHLKEAFDQCGLVQLIDNNPAKALQLAESYAEVPGLLRYLSAEQATATTGTQIHHNALYYPQGGWLDTALLRQALTDNPDIDFVGNARVSAISPAGNGWQISAGTKTLNADAVVLCNAQAANTLLGENDHLPVRAIRGQVSFLESMPARLQAVVCHDGYICPPLAGQHYTFGASFDLKDNSPNLSEQSQQHNVRSLTHFLPDFSGIGSPPLNGRVGFRCTSPDYLPLTGPVPVYERFTNDYREYRHNARALIPIPGTYHDGLFVNIGYGSRGFSSAPIGAALLRAYLCGQPWPLPCHVVQALSPARFLVKAISQGKI